MRAKQSEKQILYIVVRKCESGDVTFSTPQFTCHGNTNAMTALADEETRKRVVLVKEGFWVEMRSDQRRLQEKKARQLNSALLCSGNSPVLLFHSLGWQNI